MLSVFLSFIYIGITTFFMGFGIRMAGKRFLGYSINEVLSLTFAGLAAATVYAGIFSLFTGIGALANIGMVLFCLIVIFLGKEQLGIFLKEKKLWDNKGKILGVLLLALLFSYGTSRGYLHFDTGLYHAQAIRWIEEYGVVPGLANLHCRLAYNSSAFLLTALYSFHFLLPVSLHTVAGYMALLLAIKGLEATAVFRRKKVLVSDFLKVAALFYVSIIFTEMISPASDYFAMIFLFFLIIRWVELVEKKEEDITPYSLLCVLVAVTITIKLSAGIMLLLVIKPVVALLKEKQWKEIGIYLLAGIISVFPYLARNIILSGWLVYPLASLDFFNFDWEIPIGEVQYDSEEIRVYAKGMTDVMLKDTPISQWLPDWFTALKTLEKLWVLSSVAAIGMILLAALLFVRKKRKEKYPMIFMGLVLIAGYLFWQLSTPLVRYGYIYILAFPFFAAALWYEILLENRKKSYLLFGLCLLAFLGLKGKNLAEDIIKFSHLDHYVMQMDYQAGEIAAYKWEGQEFYVPLTQGQIGYHSFPGVPYERYDLELRGDSLKEGFRRK
ncbi:MAG: hypothetical protein IKW28_07805 [Lachnospiraceae bacterium]|nr:hypothetical protein [Lachnospiraceae bacterium]